MTPRPIRPSSPFTGVIESDRQCDNCLEPAIRMVTVDLGRCPTCAARVNTSVCWDCYVEIFQEGDAELAACADCAGDVGPEPMVLN